MASLSTSALGVQNLFDACVRVVSEYQTGSQPEERTITNGLSQETLKDAHSRFKVWCGNLGIFQWGHASLDWRLREASQVRTQVVDLLEHITDDLENCLEILSRQRPPLDLDSDDSDGDRSDIRFSGNELEVRLQSIANVLENLYRIAFAIRNQKTRQSAVNKLRNYRIRDPQTGLELFESGYYPFDRHHIHQMLSNMRRTDNTKATETNEQYEALVDRLTTANVLRRKQFSQWERHAWKLQQVVRPQPTGSAEQKIIAVVSVSEANKIGDNPKQVSILSPTSVTKTLREPVEATGFEADIDTQSSASFASTIKDVEGHEASLPNPPRNIREGRAFGCPYCFVLCPPKEASKRRWRKHILEDLRPYLCTYPHCTAGEQLFSGRSELLHHEETLHRRVWRCREHPAESYRSEHDFRAHLITTHKAMDDETVEGLVEFASTALDDDRTHCSICLRSTASLPQGQTLFKHIANHLETLATFSVPRNVEIADDDDDDDDGDDEKDGSNDPVQAGDDDERSQKSDVSSEWPDVDEIGDAGGVKISLDQFPKHDVSSADVVDSYLNTMQQERASDSDHPTSPRETAKCVHKGCGKVFDDPDEACVYHPGAPEFHDGQKGWKCCNPRVLTFDEFLNIPGCTTGKHSTIDDTPGSEAISRDEGVETKIHQLKDNEDTLQPAIAEQTNKPIVSLEQAATAVIQSLRPISEQAELEIIRGDTLYSAATTIGRHWLRKIRKRRQQSFMPSTAPEKISSGSTLPLPKFLNQSKSDVNNKFVELEWQQRNRLLLGTKAYEASPWAHVSAERTAGRNRYLNVEPYAENRVNLGVGEGENDYINASPIILDNQKYIATQGPKETTVNHFWRMIAEMELERMDHPIVIVMLTQTHEAGREKCFQYYPLTLDDTPLPIVPAVGDPNGIDAKVFLRNIRSVGDTGIVLRELILEARSRNWPSRQRYVWHLSFGNWLDFGIPEDEARVHLVRLIRLSNRLTFSDFQEAAIDIAQLEQASGRNYVSNSTRVIHCSAGVGRTGTFIALDYLLGLLEAGRLDDVADGDPVEDTVDRLRKQRMLMVQGETQLHFVYDVLREAWEERASVANDAAPGDSLADWEAVSRSLDFSVTSTHQRVTPALLECMTGREGMPVWTSLHGIVYNITPFLPYHPGGRAEIMRAAGRDATSLFQEVHPWVNADNILKSCLVGILVPEE